MPASQIIALPVLDPEANGTEEKGAFTLAADGTLTGSVDTSQSGSEGGESPLVAQVHRREGAARVLGDGHIAETLPGVTLDSFEFVEPSALDKPLEFHYKVTARQYSHQAGPLLLVRPRVVGTRCAALRRQAARLSHRSGGDGPLAGFI